MKPTNIYLGLIATLSVLMLIFAGAIVNDRQGPKDIPLSTEQIVDETSQEISTEEVSTEKVTTEESSISNTDISITVENMGSKPPSDVATTETIKPVDPEESVYTTLTESERLILATIVRLEVGGSSLECQKAVASVVLNRMRLFGLTLRQVVFQKNVFSTARLIDSETGASNYTPYGKNWQAVDEVCKDGPTLPYYVIYFRAGHHHTWATPYCQIDSTYFSYAEKYK